MEEFRVTLADRVALTLINRRQVGPSDFEAKPGGAVLLAESGRKTVIAAFQARKQEEVRHPALRQATPWGLVPFIQARLLARHLRGDLDRYTPFTGR
jgi:CRISPR-associated protein Cas1